MIELHCLLFIIKLIVYKQLHNKTDQHNYMIMELTIKIII